CSLLLDPDIAVMNKAIAVIIEANDPETVKHLLPARKAENEFSRRAAGEVLNVLGTTRSVKYLLEATADEDRRVRSRAPAALARIGGPRVVDAVLELIKDKDENIRRAAIEILNTCKDKRAVDQLIQATQDEDWWVSERAADALAELGDTRAVPAILKMLARNDRSVAVALRALGKLGDSNVLGKIVPYLRRPERESKLAAIEAIGELTTEKHAEAVRTYLHQVVGGAAERIMRAVDRTWQRIEGSIASSGQFTATGTMGMTASRVTSVAQPAARPTATAATTTSTRTLLVEDGDVKAPPLEPMTLDINALKPGDVIEGRYRFIQKLGKGAFGTVLLVEDTVVEERLRLKFLNPNVASDEEMMKRFVHELRYSRRITHKNVIRIYDFLYIGGGYAISMEYFPSHTLSQE